MERKNKLVYGWGVNDVDYNVYRTEVVDGKKKNVWRCPYYASGVLLFKGVLILNSKKDAQITKVVL